MDAGSTATVALPARVEAEGLEAAGLEAAGLEAAGLEAAVASAVASAAPATMPSAVMPGSKGASSGASAAAVAATSGTWPGNSTTEYTRTGVTSCWLFRSTIAPCGAEEILVAIVCRSPSFGWITVGDQSSSQPPPPVFRQVQVAGYVHVPACGSTQLKVTVVVAVSALVRLIGPGVMVRVSGARLRVTLSSNSDAPAASEVSAAASSV